MNKHRLVWNGKHKGDICLTCWLYIGVISLSFGIFLGSMITIILVGK